MNRVAAEHMTVKPPQPKRTATASTYRSSSRPVTAGAQRSYGLLERFLNAPTATMGDATRARMGTLAVVSQLDRLDALDSGTYSPRGQRLLASPRSDSSEGEGLDEHWGDGSYTKSIPRPYGKPFRYEDANVVAARNRRMLRQEEEMVRKLARFYAGEKRRDCAVACRLDRPRQEKMAAQAAQWVKMIKCAQPFLVFAEVLRENQARRTLRTLFSAQLQRFLRRRRERAARKDWTAQRMKNMEPIPLAVLRDVPLFSALPPAALKAVQAVMQPRCFRDGDTVVTEAENGDEMLIMARGKLEVQKAQKSKFELLVAAARLPATNTGTKQVRTGYVPGEDTNALPSGTVIDQPWTTFGENTLLFSEARPYTLVSKEDTDMWLLEGPDFLAEVEKCPQSVREFYNRKTDERRCENMRTMYSLSESAMRNSCPFLSEWSEAGLQYLLTRLEPSTFRKGVDIYKEGDKPTGMYFLLHGKVEVLRGGQKELLKVGQAFGELGCMTTNKRAETVRTLAQCDAWFLPKVDLTEMASHENIFTLLPLYKRTVGTTGGAAAGTRGGPEEPPHEEKHKATKPPPAPAKATAAPKSGAASKPTKSVRPMSGMRKR